jgi:hypothetical protein
MVQRKENVLCDAQKVNFSAPQSRVSNRKSAGFISNTRQARQKW